MWIFFLFYGASECYFYMCVENRGLRYSLIFPERRKKSGAWIILRAYLCQCRVRKTRRKSWMLTAFPFFFNDFLYIRQYLTAWDFSTSLLLSPWNYCRAKDKTKQLFPLKTKKKNEIFTSNLCRVLTTLCVVVMKGIFNTRPFMYSWLAVPSSWFHVS